MSQNYLSFVLILLTCLIATKVTDTSIPENLRSVPQEILHQLQTLQLKLDAYNQRLEHEFAKQKDELRQDMQQFYKEHQHSCVNSTSPDVTTHTSCEDAMAAGGESGVYKLHIPDSNLAPFHVYCLEDPQHGPPWTIVQRRQDGTLNFYREWNDYKTGFGDPAGEFFIGLDRLHALTHPNLQELWVKVKDFEDEIRSAKYEQFQIGNESEKYKLNVLGKFDGDAGDALRRQEGCYFSTFDKDNDQDSKRNCAKTFIGAWWYKKCFKSHLNGVYLYGKNDHFGLGITWETWHNEYYSLKYAHMAIRPVSKK